MHFGNDSLRRPLCINSNILPTVKTCRDLGVLGVFGCFVVICHWSSVQITIRYDSGYLTCSKKLTGSQLSLPHGINRKLKCETKNKMMSVISPVIMRQSSR